MPRHWRQAFARLALAAMLALALTPSIGRLAQAPGAPAAAPAAAPAPMAMPMAMTAHGEACADMPGMGMGMGMAAGTDTDTGTKQPVPAPVHPPGEDCDYCPLLASLSLPGAALPPAAPVIWSRESAPAASPGQPGRVALAGLGARGPPQAG